MTATPESAAEIIAQGIYGMKLRDLEGVVRDKVRDIVTEIFDGTTPKQSSTANAEPRMDGTLEQRLLWRVMALREALSDIETMRDGVTHQVARNALLVDDGNAKLCASLPTKDDELDAWIKREFSGHGVAIRRKTDDPIPGEPFMSMAIAKDLTRRAVALFNRHAQQTPTPEAMGRAYYLARYEKDGANWDANDHKVLWIRMAQRYHELLATAFTSPERSSQGE